jgi:hypothetical protein
MKKNILIITLLLVVTTSCNILNSDIGTGPSTSLEDVFDVALFNELNDVAAKGTRLQLRFSPFEDWSAYTDCKWINIAPKSGTRDDKKINITILENTEREERSGSIYVTMIGGKEYEIPVSQLGKELCGELDELFDLDEIDKLSDIDAKGDYFYLNFTAGAAWEAYTDSKWIKISPYSGTGKSCKLVISILENTLVDEKRNGTIYIELPKNLTYEIPVSQLGAESILNLVDGTYYEIPDIGGTISIEVKTNTTYEVVIPIEAQSWLSCDNTDNTNNSTITLSATKNISDQLRTAIVSVEYGKNKSRKFSVNQPAYVELDYNIIGSWHMTSYCGTPADVDIYMQLNKDMTFVLYQRSGDLAYSTYSGKYTIDLNNSIISGQYSDGSPWANRYYYSINSNNELVFTNTYNSSEVSVYEPAQMPTVSTRSMQQTIANTIVRPL